MAFMIRLPKVQFKNSLMSYDIKKERTIRAPVLLNLLNLLQKMIKCLASLTFYRFSTHLIDSIIYEHSCKILFLLVSVAGPHSAVGNVSGYRCVSDCISRGREFDPGPVPYFRGD